MVFRYPQKPASSLPKMDIIIDGKKIKRVDNFKFLGIELTETMSWKLHIDKLRIKISKVVGVMRRIKNFVSSHVLLKIYSTLILCHLHYGILCWGFESHRLFKIQKKAVRVLTKSKYNSHTDPLFKTLKLLKINDIFKTQCLKFLYNLKKNTTPKYFSRGYLPTAVEHSYNTRNQHQLRPARTNRQKTKKTIRYYLPTLVNVTPRSIVSKIETHSLTSYKSNVKLLFLNEYQTQCNKPNCFSCKNELN